MALNRKQMLERLEIVAPALSEHDLVPILQHLTFSGDTVTAFNDRIAISIPLKTSFKGTVPGKMLIDCLKIGEHTEEVDLQRSGNNAKFIAERAEVTMESQPLDQFIFTMPRPSREATELNEKFFAAIDDCMQSVAEHAVTADHLGVTFIPNGKETKLFSTTGNTLTHASIRLPLDLKARVVLPAAFCNQMLRLQKLAKKCTLALRNDHALFSADKINLFGKYVRVPNPLDFVGVMARHIGSAKVEPVKPDKEQRPRLKIALDYASRICDIKGNEVRTQITVKDKQMELSSVSDRGKAFDRIKLQHPNVNVRVQASLLKQVYDRYEDILITERCALMTRDNQNSVFMVACYQR